MTLGAVLPLAIYAAVMMLVAEPGHRTVRIGIALYLAACVLTALVHTPVGSNVLRLGHLCAFSVAALTVAPRRRLLLVVIAVPLLFWQWLPGSTMSRRQVEARPPAPPTTSL